jgi:dephospho-CoA kinase
VVDCDEGTQIERVMTRNGMALDVVKRIIESQAGRNIRLAAADIVISNQDVSLDSLAHEVAQLAEPFGLSLGNWK